MRITIVMLGGLIAAVWGLASSKASPIHFTDKPALNAAKMPR